MNCQELETAVRLKTPIVNVIWENGQYGSIVWKQDKKFGNHFGVDFTNPDFVKLADAFGWTGLRATKPAEMDDIIKTMIETPGPVIVDVAVDERENCFPMIPSGAAHNEMLLGPDDQKASPVSEEGMVLV